MFEPKTIKEYVAEKKAELKAKVALMSVKPCLAIVQVADNPASARYVRNKIKDCEEVGIKARLLHLPEDTAEETLLAEVQKLNEDALVTGIIVQLPLPRHIDEKKIVAAINPAKDADGFTKEAIVRPATPAGILAYLEDCGFGFRDKNAVVIGRSNIVGKPMAEMLLRKDCNVRIIHSKTSSGNKAAALAYADLVVVAAGHRDTLTDSDLEYANPDCFIVDVGINFTPEGKLVGDCENVSIRRKSPVPGGVGLTTRLQLLENLMKLCGKIEG